MSEGLKIALTAVGGVGVFVIGQIIQKWFIEPIQEQRKLIGEIVYALVYYANLYQYRTYFRMVGEARIQAKTSEGRQSQDLDEAYKMFMEKTGEGGEKLRELSSQIYQSMQVIPCYWILEKLRIVYKRKTLYEIAIKLIEWATNPERHTTIVCQNAIVHLLNIKYLIKLSETENSG
jgi:hypothetical protein